MTLSNDTVIQECTEDLQDVPTVKYEFVPINEIAEKTPNTIVGEFFNWSYVVRYATEFDALHLSVKLMLIMQSLFIACLLIIMNFNSRCNWCVPRCWRIASIHG